MNETPDESVARLRRFIRRQGDDLHAIPHGMDRFNQTLPADAPYAEPLESGDGNAIAGLRLPVMLLVAFAIGCGAGAAILYLISK